MLPDMLKRRAVRRPYLSESVPIMGDAKACRRLEIVLLVAIYSLQLVLVGGILWETYENRLPSAPPRSTISYLESIGREKEAL